MTTSSSLQQQQHQEQQHARTIITTTASLSSLPSSSFPQPPTSVPGPAVGTTATARIQPLIPPATAKVLPTAASSGLSAAATSSSSSSQQQQPQQQANGSSSRALPVLVPEPRDSSQKVTTLISSLIEDERILRELEAQEENLMQRSRRRRPLGHSRSEEQETQQQQDQHMLRRQLTMDLDPVSHNMTMMMTTSSASHLQQALPAFDQTSFRHQHDDVSSMGSKAENGDASRRMRRATSESRKQRSFDGEDGDIADDDEDIRLLTSEATEGKYYGSSRSARHTRPTVGEHSSRRIMDRSDAELEIGYFTEPEPMRDLDDDEDLVLGARSRRTRRTRGSRKRTTAGGGRSRRPLASLSDEEDNYYDYYDEYEDADVDEDQDEEEGGGDVWERRRERELKELRRELSQKLPMMQGVDQAPLPPPRQPLTTSRNHRTRELPLNDLMAKLDQDNRILAELDKQIERTSQQHQLHLNHLHQAAAQHDLRQHLQHHFHPLAGATALPPQQQQQLFFLPFNNLQVQQQHQQQQSAASLEHQRRQLTQLRLLQQQQAAATHEAQDILDSIFVPNRGRARVFIAKYSYDPFRQSPNENPETELSLAAGDFILVFGDLDSDGFFFGSVFDEMHSFFPSYLF